MKNMDWRDYMDIVVVILVIFLMVEHIDESFEPLEAIDYERKI